MDSWRSQVGFRWHLLYFLCFRLLKEPQDALKTTTPLLNKVILTWLTDSYIYVRTTEVQRTVLGIPKPRGIGYGIGLAVALFIMQGISTFEFFFFPPLYVATQNLRAWWAGSLPLVFQPCLPYLLPRRWRTTTCKVGVDIKFESNSDY